MNKLRVRKLLLVGLAVSLLLIAFVLPVHADNQTFAFPSASSTVVASGGFLNATEIGWFWSVARGDSVSQTLSTSLAAIDGAVLDIEVVNNSLNSGAQVDWDVEINGVVVDSFTINEGFTGVVHRDVSFAPIAGPTYDIAIIVTNEVPGGAGSISLAYADPYAHSIELVGGPPPPVASVGGEVFPVNKVTLLAPWIALSLALIFGGFIVAGLRREHS